MNAGSGCVIRLCYRCAEAILRFPAGSVPRRFLGRVLGEAERNIYSPSVDADD